MSRIIAGSHGGRRLTTPPGSRTRPTTDRVREALFSAVAAWAGTADAPADEALAGLAFADLFAGSGAVGLEAASRGAGPVLLVEADKRTVGVTTRNVRDLGLAGQVRTGKVETVVASPSAQAYDVVFLDPPYELAGETLAGVLQALADGGWLTADALLVVERSRRTPDPVWPPLVTDTWSRTYGETVLHFGSCAGPPDGPPAAASPSPGSAPG
ncbi:16S rRNA (guanine966-N2)-methyltransferase [Friedmanniella luteola]|uniref:16S rRNA (Guanine966-N2)-methyltransferase n=1 Tax=Friedmanniella luteola TaxID=546871 RepID=A0A1H1Q830_9ACTN|nr:16S rRNA (guanine(966)-N(2))-methyltransferase RsmD [Friedmanniella luteola]SDS19534.1 16S rRNA (guanine966-N2)-methyltransferase [Friedmanniella luteola]